MTPAIDLHDVRVMCSNGRNVYPWSVNTLVNTAIILHLIDPENVIPFSDGTSSAHEFFSDCKWGSCCSIFSLLCNAWYIICPFLIFFGGHCIVCPVYLRLLITPLDIFKLFIFLKEQTKYDAESFLNDLFLQG
jgi:hypothetical protein